MLIDLSEIELDALAETFNLALGEAAAMFSAMVHEEVALSVPTVELIRRADLASELQASLHSSRLCAIRQDFESNSRFKTNTMLLFPEHSSLEIVRRMLGDSTPIEQLTELEQDTLAEVGNIIMNSCMSSLANLFGIRMTGTLPQVNAEDAHDLLSEDKPQEVILVARISMTLAAHNLSGFVLFVMDPEAIESLLEQVRLAFKI